MTNKSGSFDEACCGKGVVTEFSARSLSFRINLADAGFSGEWCEPGSTGGQDVTLGVHFYQPRRSATRQVKRPALFFFNGGPGASSTPLHFSGFGPYLVEDGDEGDVRILDNPETLLDVADLIYIDPVGTGFNRIPATGEAGAPAERFLGVDGDAALAALVIREWLAAYGTPEAPVYLCGQSYGGFRIATAAPYLADVNLCGLILLSPALSMSGRHETIANDMAYLFTLPTMAVAAQYHGLRPSDLSAIELHRAAADFALDTYASALVWGVQLGAARRSAIALEVSKWIGLPPQRVLDQNLRIEAEAYMRELLAPRPLRIGSLDVRGTGSLAPMQDRPTNDPSLVLKRSSGRNETYFREVLGVEAKVPYVGLSFEVNGRWDWVRPDLGRKFYLDATEDLVAAMAAHESLQVLAVAGVYDMSTPALATRHALTRPGVPPGRVSILDVEGGHTPYDTPVNRACVARAIRSLIKAAGVVADLE